MSTDIISDLFLEIVDTSAYYFLDPPWPMPDSVTPLKMIELYSTKHTKKIALLIDTNNITNPSLDGMVTVNSKVINNYLDSLELSLLNNISYKKIGLGDLSSIKNVGNYELYYKSEHLNLDPNFVISGEINFSKIIFNKEMNIGGFVYTVYNDPRSTKREFIIVKKEYNKWILLKRISLWVS